MTKPRSLLLAIATTALAFAAGLGIVISGPMRESSADAGGTAPRQVALVAVRQDPSTPVHESASAGDDLTAPGPTSADLR